jgi:hypothetical protein
MIHVSPKGDLQMRKPRILVGVATAALLLGLAGPSAALGTVVPVNGSVCTFAAADSAYYNGPTPAAGLYATGPLTFSWEAATGNVVTGLWTETYPAYTGSLYPAWIVSGTVGGGLVNMTTAVRFDGYHSMVIQGTLVNGVFTGTADGPYLLTATGTVTCPTAPVILTPPNNSVLTTAQLTQIDWTDSTGTGTITYQYQAFSDAAYTALIYDSGFSLSASDIPTPGTPPGVYYVRVRAQDSMGTSDWSNGSSNPYKITVSNIAVTALSPAKMWIGLKNSDDVGTKFDLKAEVLLNGASIGSGEILNVPGGSSGFNNAVNRSIDLALSGSPATVTGDTLSFRLSVRIAATSGHRSGTARLWFNDTAANSLFDATIGGANADYYLRDGFVLGTSAGATKKTIDVFADRLVNSNAWKAFGTWSITLP